MKRYHLATLVAALALTLGATAGCSDDKKKAGCTKDTDCKGERVCQKGACVDPKGSAEADGTDGKGGKKPQGLSAALKAARKRAAGPGAGATGPSTAPSGPNAGPGAPGSGGGAWKKDSIRMCLGTRCVGLGRGFGSNTRDMRAMLDMLKQLVFSGLGGMGSGQLPKLKVCVGPQCVKVDKNLLSNPMALIKLFSNLNPQMLRKMFRGSGGKRPGLRPLPRSTTPGAPPRATPPGAKPLRSFAELLGAGDRARGRQAELSGLSITSVSDTRLVLEGPGREMIVLRIPSALKSLIPKLRITTSQVTVRFRVLSRPIGKLVHGELLGYD